MEKNYFKERDENNLSKLRDLQKAMPAFVREFFIGIQNTTSVLTRLNYAYDLRIFFDYLSVNCFTKPVTDITLGDLDKLSAFDIELFLDYLSNYSFNGKKFSCTAPGKQRKLSSVRSFFSYYFKKDKLQSNVSQKVDMPKIRQKSIVRLESDEIARLLDEVESENITKISKHQNAYIKHTKLRDIAIITLFLGTGIRISELVGLNRNDIDFSSNSFVVTRKGGNQSILYFNDEIKEPLARYIETVESDIKDYTEFGKKIGDSPALFFSLQGSRISTRAVQNLVKKFSSIITPLKKITPHKLRSTFGTQLYRNTQDIYVVADVLGHKDINTTKKHYADISDEIRRGAAKTIVLRDNKPKS